MKNFAITGVGGFVAARHLRAIADTDNTLIAALDPNDSVGILDNYFPDAQFFTSDVRFARLIEKMRMDDDPNKIDYLSICTPNHIHDAHIRMGLRAGADVICEKPLVINPWNLDQLLRIEEETGQHVYTMLQLRRHPSLEALKAKLKGDTQKHDVVLTYITRRGQWYHVSWKGDEEKSGGLAMNIGVHFFDLLMWLFGDMEASELHYASPEKMSGYLELENARVRWFLSIDYDDLPQSVKEKGGYGYRSITIDGEELEFSGGFTDLHTVVYQDVLNGGGYRIADSRPSIELIYQLRQSEIITGSKRHPMLEG